jgi:hypothetical protein
MDKQEALQWFVDFANMDLQTIKPGDKAKLLVEAEEYLWPREELKSFRVIHTPEALSEKMGRMAWALEIPPRESAEYWAAIVRSREGIRKLFSHNIIRVTAHFSPEISMDSLKKSAISVVALGHDEVLWRTEKGPNVPYTTILLPLTGSQDEYLCLKILMLLEGLPQHAIRKCPGCEQFFFNPTRRKKEFCSPKCMWRVTAGKRRKELKEKHPKKYKAYLKKQREIMIQRYEEKQKAKGYSL